MCRWKCRLSKAVMAVAVSGFAMPLLLRADDAPSAENAKNEQGLLERIDKLSSSLRTDLPLSVRLTLNDGQLREIVAISDDFLKLFPKSPARDRVLVAKLAALAELARTRPEYLDELLAFTKEVSAGQPKEPLASECAFYAIQVFVHAARREGMSRDRRMQGMVERYASFLDDYPQSQRRPVIRASLVRNLLAIGRVKEAEIEVSLLAQEFPGHPAARRARGELFRATAVGKPFALRLGGPDGKTVNTADFKGKVVVLHFWSSANSRAIDGLKALRELYSSFQGKGLVMMGINVDEDRATFEESVKRQKLPWRQHFEPGGFGSEILTQLGVIRLPSYFVVDRAGILRHSHAGNQLREIVEKLLKEKDSPQTPKTPG